MLANRAQLETSITESPALVPYHAFLAALALVAVIPGWILPASASFWLDETLTYFVISGGIKETFSRALLWTGETPFYYLIAWVAKTVGHSNEFMVRLPSLLAMGIATHLVFRIGAKLMDRETGLLAAIFFACSSEVAFAAADARPYAVAMLMLLASTYMLLQWLENERTQFAAGYILFSALTIYTHYVFSAGLGIPALYALCRVRLGGSISHKKLFTAWLSVGVLIAPLIPNFLMFYKARSLYLFADKLPWRDLFTKVVPLPISVILTVAALLVCLRRTTTSDRQGFGPYQWSMLIAWSFLLPILYFVLSMFTDIRLFVPRYFLSTAPGLALLAACLLRRVGTASVRQVVATSFAVFSVLSLAVPGGFWHGNEDWKGAIAKVRDISGNSHMTVLICPGFVEGRDAATLTDPARRVVYLSPLIRYPLADTVIPLPYVSSSLARPYFDELATNTLVQHNQFLLVARGSTKLYRLWLEAILPGRFKLESQGDFGLVTVTLFTLTH